MGVGPGSPSRDAANWLLSRFCLSVETRRQYGWLRMVFSGELHLLRRFFASLSLENGAGPNASKECTMADTRGSMLRSSKAW